MMLHRSIVHWRNIIISMNFLRLDLGKTQPLHIIIEHTAGGHHKKRLYRIKNYGCAYKAFEECRGSVFGAIESPGRMKRAKNSRDIHGVAVICPHGSLISRASMHACDVAQELLHLKSCCRGQPTIFLSLYIYIKYILRLLYTHKLSCLFSLVCCSCLFHPFAFFTTVLHRVFPLCVISNAFIT